MRVSNWCNTKPPPLWEASAAQPNNVVQSCHNPGSHQPCRIYEYKGIENLPTCLSPSDLCPFWPSCTVAFIGSSMGLGLKGKSEAFSTLSQLPPPPGLYFILSTTTATEKNHLKQHTATITVQSPSCFAPGFLPEVTSCHSPSCLQHSFFKLHAQF